MERYSAVAKLVDKLAAKLANAVQNFPMSSGYAGQVICGYKAGRTNLNTLRKTFVETENGRDE
jgi:hypothetical protein